MNKKLTKHERVLLTHLVNPVVLKTVYSPSISRAIPAPASVLPVVTGAFWLTIGFTSGILLFFIALTVGEITENADRLYQITQTRQAVLQESAYWQGVVKEYPMYRDGYIKLALLSSQLGDSEQARVYMDEALVIDPQYEKQAVLKARLGE